MSLCYVLLFGYGREGDVRYINYDGSGVLEYVNKTTLHSVRPGEEPKTSYQSIDKVENYIVSVVKLGKKGESYLIATDNGELPDRVEDRIRAAGLEPAPSSF